MELPDHYIPFGDLVANFVTLHEIAVHRPERMSNLEYESYELLMNRMAAEFAHALVRRARDAALGLPVVPDLVSNCEETAGTLAEAIKKHWNSLDEETQEELFEATKNYPR